MTSSIPLPPSTKRHNLQTCDNYRQYVQTVFQHFLHLHLHNKKQSNVTTHNRFFQLLPTPSTFCLFFSLFSLIATMCKPIAPSIKFQQNQNVVLNCQPRRNCSC